MRTRCASTVKWRVAGIAAAGTLATALIVIFPHIQRQWPGAGVSAGLFLATGVLGAAVVLGLRWGRRHAHRAAALEKRVRELDRRFAERTTLLESVNCQLEAAVEEAARQTRRAERASEAKSSFLARMSHEIRTPMTAILGFTECLGDESLSRQTRMEAVHTIRRNGQYLLQLINDLLDLSKIEAGRLALEIIPCSPVALVEDVNSLLDIRAETKGLSFDLGFLGPIPETIETDPTRLRQILINLVGNAIKFTTKGGLAVVTRLVERNSADPKLEFRVIDTGPGLSEEQIGNLFQPFCQGDISTSRTHGGTGLGLSISRRLARMLGGDITVASRVGQGSTFSLTVRTGPLQSVRMIDAGGATHISACCDATPELPPAPLVGRVLVVEDCPDNQRLLRFMLENAGADVTIAGNGRIGVELTQRAIRAQEPFDAILMDMQMPVMDGYAATRALRAWGYEGPIIATTAHAMKDQLAECIEAGCDAHITKPIDRTAMLDTIARCMAAPTAESLEPVEAAY